MPHTLRIAQLLMQIFPQLSTYDFRQLNPQASIAQQLEQWQQHDIAHDYMIDCDFSNWANELDLKIKFLELNAQHPIEIDQTLDTLYDFFEELEQQQEDYDLLLNDDSAFSDDDGYETLNEDDDVEVSEDILSVETIILQNLLNCLLRQGINVLLLEYPHKFQMILNQGKAGHMQLLRTLLLEADLDAQLYLAKEYSHQQFPYLIGKF